MSRAGPKRLKACPGLPFTFDGVLYYLVFCSPGQGTSGPPAVNTAIPSVIYHEYGHEIIEEGGSGQGPYGEGMADTIAFLMTGDPRMALGVVPDECESTWRTADNDCQYDPEDCSDCGGLADPPHLCGRLLSGILWDIREALKAKDPAGYRDVVNALILGSITEHEGTTIDETIQARSETVRADPMAPKKQRQHDKRMAIVTANWEQERQPRTAEPVLANLDRQPSTKKQRGPRPQNERVCASVEKSQAQGISEMFDEIERRNPQRERTTVVLLDGEEKQLEQAKRQAESCGLTLTIILDLIHVIHYLWIAGYVLCRKDTAKTEARVRESLGRLLTGPANYLAASIRRQATMMNLTAADRQPVDKCCDYLLKYQDYLRYAEYLAEGFPIATGVIAGACRHLVEDRMGITGARWDVPGAEAVLRLRAIRCSSDWDEYWEFHERQELSRTHDRVAA